MNTEINIVILAAGKGTRLGVDLPKPLLKFQQSNLIHQVIENLRAFRNENDVKLSIILGHKKELISNYLTKAFPKLEFEYICQEKQLGTGHAISEYFSQTQNNANQILILCADTPLINSECLSKMTKVKAELNQKACGLSFITNNPHGYGRVKRIEGHPGVSVVEEIDASDTERGINEVNSGIYLTDKTYLESKIKNLDNKNKSGEFYLTDIMDINENCDFLKVENGEKLFLGVNTMKQLEEAEEIARTEKIKKIQSSGVLVVDSKNTYIDNQVIVEPGVRIMPNVHLRGNSVIKKNTVIETGSVITDSIIEENVTVNPYTIIDDSKVQEGAMVGPFARIRPGTDVGENCRVGNFVETKKSVLKAGSKVSHLSYVGDAEIGRKTNIGCGFITCNYDGKNKHKTSIGENCFIGSDSQVVAPIKIGNNCFVASGSTINSDLNDGDFAISRSRQVTKEGMAKKFLKNK